MRYRSLGMVHCYCSCHTYRCNIHRLWNRQAIQQCSNKHMAAVDRRDCRKRFVERPVGTTLLIVVVVSPCAKSIASAKSPKISTSSDSRLNCIAGNMTFPLFVCRRSETKSSSQTINSDQLSIRAIPFRVSLATKQEIIKRRRNMYARDLRSFVIRFDFESYVRFEIRFVVMVRFEIFESSALSIVIREETIGGG